MSCAEDYRENKKLLESYLKNMEKLTWTETVQIANKTKITSRRSTTRSPGEDGRSNLIVNDDDEQKQRQKDIFFA